MELYATPPRTTTVVSSPFATVPAQTVYYSPSSLSQPMTIATPATQLVSPAGITSVPVQTATVTPLLSPQPVLTSQPMTLVTPPPSFVPSPGLVVSSPGRSGNYALVYTDITGKRSRMLNVGAINQVELQTLQSVIQWRNQRLQQLVNLQLLSTQPFAYASPNPQIPTGRVELGRIDLVDLNSDPVAAASYQWTRREVEGYFLAPFDIGTTTAPAPESLGVSLQELPPQVRYFLYPSYYPRA